MGNCVAVQPGGHAVERALDENCTRKLIVALRAGAPADGVPSKSGTALHRAVHLGEPVLVKALLRGGASLRAQDRYGKTALEVARTRSIAQPSDARALVVSLIESAAERAHAAGLARAVREAPRGAVLRVTDLAARLGEGEDKEAREKSGLAEPAPTLEGVKLHAEESCVVCLQAGAASVALLPCGHQCLCRECTCKTLAGLVVPLPDEADGCPVCRTTVTAVVVLAEKAAEVEEPAAAPAPVAIAVA